MRDFLIGWVVVEVRLIIIKSIWGKLGERCA